MAELRMVDEHDANVIPFPRGQFERAHNELEAALDEQPVRPKHEVEAITW